MKVGLKNKNSKDICESDIEKFGGDLRYGSYQASVGRNISSFDKSIEEIIVSFDSYRSLESKKLARQIISFLENAYGPINHGWYLQMPDGRQYGLTEGNSQNFEIKGKVK